ncbi:MAG TPA: hypothetical protein VFA70_11255 [Dehalococcoidia bacterium]|nr:hypothetical protein [Dehalococcoidia bacterium]
MKSVLGALLGVPATMLVAGGLGLMGVTVFSRLVRREGREPIRWAHLVLGLVMLVAGAALVDLEVVLFGAS